MTCTQKQYSAIRAAVRKAFFDSRDSYFWYLEHEPDSSMTAYYCERYEQYAALRDMFTQADGIVLNIK